MKTTVPFTKDILFKSKIADITSISLEHELDIKDDSINGNFIISGDYKTHEVCINKEEFEYKLPFSVEITDNIDINTLEFEITDFNYDIIGNDTLRVNIEFNVTAEEKKESNIEERKTIEVETDKLFEEPEEEIIKTKIDEINIPIQREKDCEEKDNIANENIEKEETLIQEINNDCEEDILKEESLSEERIDKADEQTILDAVSEKDDEFTTYNIHIVRGSETIESISQKYSTTIDIINEYNNIEELNIGDKIIIPQLEDE